MTDHNTLQEHRLLDNETTQCVRQAFHVNARKLRMDFGAEEAQVRVDDAADAAIALIVEAGFDSSDSDLFGNEVSDVLQTLLQIAMMRCPQLADRIMGRDDVIIKAVELS